MESSEQKQLSEDIESTVELIALFSQLSEEGYERAILEMGSAKNQDAAIIEISKAIQTQIYADWQATGFEHRREQTEAEAKFLNSHVLKTAERRKREKEMSGKELVGLLIGTAVSLVAIVMGLNLIADFIADRKEPIPTAPIN